MRNDTYTYAGEVEDPDRPTTRLVQRGYRTLLEELNRTFRGRTVAIDEEARNAMLARLEDFIDTMGNRGENAFSFQISRTEGRLIITVVYAWENRKGANSDGSYEDAITWNISEANDQVTLQPQPEHFLRQASNWLVGQTRSKVMAANAFRARRLVPSAASGSKTMETAA